MNGFESQSSTESFVGIESYGNEGAEVAQEFVSTYPQVYLDRQEASVDSWRYTYVKRVLDALMASAMLVALAIPGLFIAAAILMTTKGPIFFREKRIGRYGRPFRIWKFRSMYTCEPRLRGKDVTGDHGNHFSYRIRKNHEDPRITPIGGFLRRWSLDELPQLINVLRGEMSMIGPRPIVEAEACFYSDLLPFYLAATPGLSGLWQVSGRSNIDYPKRAALDASYVLGWSLTSDFEILIQTIPAVLRRTGAC